VSTELTPERKIPNVLLYYACSVVVIKTPLALVLFAIGVLFGLPSVWWLLVICFFIAIGFNMLYDNLLIEMTTLVVEHEVKKKIAIELANRAILEAKIDE
jgi:Zn-dependent membrane protease YugP